MTVSNLKLMTGQMHQNKIIAMYEARKGEDSRFLKLHHSSPIS